MIDEDSHPSEVLYDICKQPPPCCPLIGEALDKVTTLQRRMRGYERAEEDELKDILNDVEYALGELSGYGRTGLIEDIRTRVEEVRAWGQEWKDLAKRHAPLPESVTL